MTSVGETLRRERLKRNLDLDHISRELKISQRLLDAIESDQYDRLPGGVFAKSFVRQYAQLVGLDGEDLASQVQREIQPPAPQSAEQTRPAVDLLPKVEAWQGAGESRFRMTGSLPAAALVVVVMLICSAVYAWIQRPRTTATAESTPPAPIKLEPRNEPAPAPVGISPPPVATEPAPAPSVGLPTAAATVQPAVPSVQPAPPAARKPAAKGPVHLEITADEVVWVFAKVDGQFAFTGTMEANSRRELDGEKDVVLRLGNAGGVTISLNGKSIGPAGPKGQPRTLQFTSGGFQIVSANPVAPVPFDPLDRL